jgi:hypothetical protein
VVVVVEVVELVEVTVAIYGDVFADDKDFAAVSLAGSRWGARGVPY